MKKRTKIMIGIAVFVVTMGLIVTAVIMAVLTGKKNAELYPAEYDWIAGSTYDGAYVAVVDGSYVLAREGGILSDRYVYLTYAGSGRFVYRDDRGGQGYLDTDGDVLGKARPGEVCLYADGDYAIKLDGSLITAGDFADTLADGEVPVDDFAVNAALCDDMYAVEKSGGIEVRWDGGSVLLPGFAPTGVRGLVSYDNGVYSLQQKGLIADGTVRNVLATAEPALAVEKDGTLQVYNGNGEAIWTGLERNDVVRLFDSPELYGATYRVPVDFIRTETGFETVRGGEAVPVGQAVAQTPRGAVVLDGRRVSNSAGDTIKEFRFDVSLIDGAYAVEYSDGDRHFVEPLDGKAFECPAGTRVWQADSEETVFGHLGDDGTLTLFDAYGKTLETFAGYDGSDVAVFGRNAFLKQGDGYRCPDGTTVDAVAHDGRFAFRAQAGKLTVVKVDTMAEHSFYLAGTPELSVTPYGTVVRDGLTGLSGFIAVDGKFTVKPSYRGLTAHNGYLLVTVDGMNWSMADHKGKLRYNGLRNCVDLGVCAFGSTPSGEGVLLDAHGRDMLENVSGVPTKLTAFTVVRGLEYAAVTESQQYYKLVSGKVRLLRTVL